MHDWERAIRVCVSWGRCSSIHRVDTLTFTCKCRPEHPAGTGYYHTSPLLPTLQALWQAGQSVSQPSATAVAVGIASAEYNSYIVSRFVPGVSAYSATGGAPSVASGEWVVTNATCGWKE